jgi:preprotein translocase subunit SecE
LLPPCGRDRLEKLNPMAVAELEKAPKSAMSDAVGWLPRKIAEGRAFIAEVRSELKKVTWPGRREVYSTTIVVIATSIFFGFYLWGLDLVFSRILSLVMKR